MSGISRRRFIAAASLAAGAAAIAPRRTAAEPPPENPAADRIAGDLVSLGRTGLKPSRLGMGTGTHGVRRASNQQRLGEAKFNALVRHAVEHGVRYFDTADQYGMHIFLRNALRQIEGLKREELFIQSKIRATHPAVAAADIERFRQELGVEYLDSLLMHCMTRTDWPDTLRQVMDVMADAKRKGVVRAVGISCHSLEALKAAVRCEWVDVVLARINPFGSTMDGTPAEVAPVLADLHKAGKGVIGMKLLGCGRHVATEERLKSLDYVIGLGSVACFTIGFESPQQIDQVLAQIGSLARGGRGG